MGERATGRLRVLMSAFACEPNQGSEPEVGWQWAVQMARFHELTVVTQSKNRPAIERAVSELAKRQSVPRFVYFDRALYLQRLRKWRTGLQIYCTLWHRAASAFIGELHRRERFELMHHVTIAGFRYRPAIFGHGVPALWGPIGGIEISPLQLLPWRYFGALVPELVRNLHNHRQNWPLSSFRRRLAHATLTLASTREMGQLIERLRFPARVMPTIGLKPAEIGCKPRELTRGPLKLLYVGNVIALKGLHLALEALANSGTDAALMLIGAGNLRAPMEARAASLGLGQRVKFAGRLPMSEVMKAYGEYDVLIFPSLHDTGGYAVIEAMCNGLPVICLDCGGPALAVREGSGMKIPIGSRQAVIDGICKAIQAYHGDRQLLLAHSRAARQTILDNYDWDKKGEQLDEVYRVVAGMGR